MAHLKSLIVLFILSYVVASFVAPPDAYTFFMIGALFFLLAIVGYSLGVRKQAIARLVGDGRQEFRTPMTSDP